MEKEENRQERGTWPGIQENPETSIDWDIIDKLYAGWLGKVIGVRHGAPVEGWTYERIRKVHGRIDGYVEKYRNFAADDDTNVPVYLIRAMERKRDGYDLKPQDVGEELMNASPYEHGFFWWGGYGISTEHTAYTNLMNGIPTPASGSMAQNGSTVAEQIGGQIFIDVWGLICPGDPDRAAYLAECAASVTHDGNGIYGGIFIACCISIAYVEKDIRRILNRALSYIPHTCEYARAVRAVMAYHEKQPEDWEACYRYIYENWGYDRYPGNCHIIPNAAVMILALLYGNGDFDETLNIGVMCGWDTDCNVGNIGAIVGVRGGTACINYEKWAAPVNDLMICSGTLGDQNITDNARITDYLLRQMEKTTGKEAPAPLHEKIGEQGQDCHFEYPGSTHCMRGRSVSGELFLENVCKEAYSGRRSLKAGLGGEWAEIYKKTYYFPRDFSDSRYDPSFSPILYPGQSLRAALKPHKALSCRLFVKDSRSGIRLESGEYEISGGEWKKMVWRIPADKGLALIDEAGILIRKGPGETVVYLDDFGWDGKSIWEIRFDREQLEDWRINEQSGPHFEISQMARWKGITYLEEGWLHVTGADMASAFTGSSGWEDVRVETEIVPVKGMHHYLNFRVQGAMRSYAFGLDQGEAVLLKNKCGYRKLSGRPFAWKEGEAFRIRIEAHGRRICAFINGEQILEFTDEGEAYLYGGVGLTTREASHVKCRWIRAEEQ